MKILQSINAEENGISFTEESFTDLYNEWYTDVQAATVKGVLIGAAGVGLVWIGVAGFNKIKKRKLEVLGREVAASLEEVVSFQPEVIEAPDENVKIKQPKDIGDLAEIIMEINENYRNVKL